MVNHLSCRLLAIPVIIACLCGCSRSKEQVLVETPLPPLPPIIHVKAVWVTRWEYNSPETLRRIMANVKSIGLNTVYLQVRGEATTFYKSAIDPWAIELHKGEMDKIGQYPGWDPLAVAIEAAHGQDIKIEAYVNIMPVWQRRTPPPKSSGHVFVSHPEWLMVNKKGNRMDPAVDHFYSCINPVREDVRKYLVSVVAELAKNYPGLDGIHYDYIRYPSDAGDYSYDPVSLAEYARHHHDMTPSRMPNVWRKWRCDNIDRLLAEMRAGIRQVNPTISLSAATFAGYWTAVNAMGQRWLQWTDKDLVDNLVPMVYDDNLDRFKLRVNKFCDSEDSPKDRRVIIGFWPNAAWKKYDMEMLKAQMETIKTSSAAGYSIFSYGAVFPKHEPNAFAAYVREFNDSYDTLPEEPPAEDPTTEDISDAVK